MKIVLRAGFAACGLTLRWSGRVRDKVPSSNVGARRSTQPLDFMIFRLLIVSVLLVGCEAAPEPKAVPQSPELVSVSKLSRDGGKVTFRLRNVSSKTVAYAHWFGMDAEPVAYCRSVDDSIRPCGTKAVVTPDNDFWTHEIYLKPGGSIRFVEQPGDASAVGVLLWVDNKERYVWSTSRP